METQNTEDQWTHLLTTNSHNLAAWAILPRSPPFLVQESYKHHPGEHEVLVANMAVAINPIDWMLQESDVLRLPYPNIFGCDVGGIIVEVGSKVSDLKPAQCVIGHALGMDTTLPKHAGFQRYTVLNEALVCEIPNTMELTDAVVLPCAISTAAAGLFQETALSMSLPSHNAPEQDAWVLIWGGSSSVGSCAIQLARAAGYKVITTAGAKNLQYCKDLGAISAFDHRDPAVEEKMFSHLRGEKLIGVFDAVSSVKTVPVCVRILSRLRHEGAYRVAITNPVKLPEKHQHIELVHGSIADDAIGPAIYKDFLPMALKTGQIKPRPKAVVVGHGLEVIQGAVNKLRKGVSASKLVVTL